jgi:acyl phosphate:glycerol-3-phosphate acyltransferase
VVVAIVWISIAVMFRYSSLASLAAALAAPLLALIGEYSWSEILFLVAIAALIFWRHGANIARLRAGAEPRIGAKKEDPDAAPAVAGAAVAPATAEPAPEPTPPTDRAPEA